MFNSLSTSVYNTHTKLLALSLVRVFVFFLFVCMCVCVLFFFIIIIFTVPQWEDRKFNFFDIIIFAFLETQSPSGSPPPSKYTSVPFLFFKLVALLVLLVQHVIATTWIFQAFWARDHLTYSPLSLSEDHCLSFQKVLFVVDLVFLLAKMQWDIFSEGTWPERVV